MKKKNESTNSCSMQKNKKQRIAVYGFDSAGYDIQDEHSLTTEWVDIKFISIDNPITLDSFNGVIIPSGIFENFKDQSNYIHTYVAVYCKRDLMLQRERELINLLNKDGWICCLIGKIIDKVPNGYGFKKCNDTDLTKCLLNSYGIERNDFEGSASVVSINDEFKSYIQRWGVAKTILKLSYHEQDSKILAKIRDYVVGVEFSGKIFFLPFHSTNLTKENAENLAKELCRAIHDYRQKRITQIPDWVNEFQFKEEEILRKKYSTLLEEADLVRQNILELQSYKGIITQSGEVLKDNVVLILKKFFKLSVTDVEDFKEDAVIRDNDGKAIVIVEIKGTKGGVKRKHLNQLDTNRERIDVSQSVPGLLIINDQMGVEGISQRQDITVAEEQVGHAKNLNILIIRTLDLLFLMRNFEKEDSPGKKLIEFCNMGGGRLIVDGNGEKIIT